MPNESEEGVHISLLSSSLQVKLSIYINKYVLFITKGTY